MLLIQNGTVLDPSRRLEQKADLLIRDDGTIAGLFPSGEKTPASGFSGQIIDASGCIVAPGLVDTHSHFRDPGFTWKEDLHTGSLAAAAGGYTSVILMANTNPPVDNADTLTDVLTRGQKEAIHIYSAANVTRGMSGKELTDFSALAGAGARVFTDDGKPVLDEELFRHALLQAAALGIPVSLHEEDPRFIRENGINAGSRAAGQLGITGSDRQAEVTMIRRDTEIAAELGAKLLIQHISTKEGVELVRRARKKNPQIHAEATPQHFSITEDAVLSAGSLAKVNPPLRTEEDRLAIIQGLADGTIDIIATDHAPHSKKEKDTEPLWKAPSGMIGLETALSLAIRNLVEPGYLSMMDMLALLTCNPAGYYGLPAGTLAEGAPGDAVIFDPTAHWTVSGSFASKSGNSPFIGMELPGVVRCTIASGSVIYQK